MFREGAPLLKVGMVMMALALVLVIGAVVASVVLRGDPGRAVAEVAKKALGEPSFDALSRSEAPQNSSPKEEGGATKKDPEDPGEEEPPRYSSSREGGAPEHGSFSGSGGPMEQRDEEAGETAGAAPEAETSGARHAMSRSTGGRTPSGPGPQRQQNQTQLEDQTLPAGGRTPSGMPLGPSSTAPSESGAQPQRDQGRQADQFLPAAEGSDWPRPTEHERAAASAPRHYELLPGAVMSLTIDSIGIYDAPVFDSDARWALVKGIAHTPGTSLPWSNTPQRNVYLSGHRMGFRGTWSRMLFYNLDELSEGDKVVLKDRSGRAYKYKVSEIFLADPTDTWVMGQVRGRDMVSLQTCTPIPTFEKRLIVRADRI